MIQTGTTRSDVSSSLTIGKTFTVQPLTVGSAWVDNTYYPYHQTGYPWWNSGTVTIWPTAAVWCSGETHVFACEHADKCRCGKAARVPEPKKCGACGK